MPAYNSRDYRLKSVFGLLLLLAVVLIILCGGPSSLTQARVESQLQQFAAHLAQASGGRQGNFTHGAVTMEGWGYDKHALVADVKLEFIDKTSPQNTLAVTTPHMLVLPDEASSDGMVFEFPESLTVSENGQPKTSVQFQSPVRYVYFDGKEAGVHTISHTLRLSPQVTLTPVDQNSGRIIVSYDANPVFRIKSQPEQQTREAVYEFRNVKISGDDGSESSIASLSSHFSEKPGPDNKPKGKYTLTVNDFSANDKQGSKPYSLNADIDYTGDVLMGSTLTPVPGSGATELNVNQVSITSDDFKLHAQGRLSTATDDPLPFGALTLSVENVPQFLASDLVPSNMRKAVADALEKASGQAVTALTNVDIALKRDKNSTFYVGNVPFETLATAMMADMMQLVPPPAAGTPLNAPVPTPNATPLPTPGATPVPPVTPVPSPTPTPGATPEPAPSASPVPTPSPTPSATPAPTSGLPATSSF